MVYRSHADAREADMEAEDDEADEREDLMPGAADGAHTPDGATRAQQLAGSSYRPPF